MWGEGPYENEDFNFYLNYQTTGVYLVIPEDDYAWLKFKTKIWGNPSPFDLNFPVLAMWATFVVSLVTALVCCCVRSVKWHKKLWAQERDLGLTGLNARMIDPNNAHIPMDYLSWNWYNPYQF